MENHFPKETLTMSYCSYSEFASAFIHGNKPTVASVKTTKPKSLYNYGDSKHTNVHKKENLKEHHSQVSNLNLEGVPASKGTELRYLEWKQIVGLNLDMSTLMMYPNPSQRTIIFHKLERQIEYLKQPHLTNIKFQGKWRSIPRKQAAYGDIYCGEKKITYTYSGLMLTPRSWTEAPILNEIRLYLNRITGYEYNFVLVNRYKDGNDKVGDHKDDEKEIDKNVPIASISFGQERLFALTHQLIYKKNLCKSKDLRYNLILKDGMLLLMNPPTNQFWYHGIPRQSLKLCPNVRINLTFRKIYIH